MAREREIKLKLKIPLESFLAKIKRQGFKLKNTLEQLDIYFDTKDWYLYEYLAALRLRVVNGENHSFSFKKMFYLPDKLDKYFIEEIEVKYPFQDLNKINQIFQRLNLQNNPIFKTEKELITILKNQNYSDDQRMFKQRRIFRKDGNEIVIDDIKRVGVVIELECKKDEPLRVIQNILDKNEWERELEGTSYAWLKKVKGLNSHFQNLKKFQSQPDWNVWENEKEMYAKLSNR